MAYGTVNADVIGTSVAGSNLGAGNASIMKNRIINGAMVINQRATSVTNIEYVTDRWQFNGSQGSKGTAQQSSTAPSGFNNSLLFTSSSAFSVGASDYFGLQQPIEGYNVADLGWGTANAKTVTLSFWVQSSLTGTFSVSFVNADNTRSYAATYTINSANTWEQKSVTVVGDTSGTWGKTNGRGITIWFGIGTGSTYSGTAGSWSTPLILGATGATSVVGTNGATFYITGVQLEVGSSATGFEYRQYGQELALCQRYYEKNYDASVVPGTATTTGLKYSSGNIGSSTTSYLSDGFVYQIPKRATPTITIYDNAGNSAKLNRENFGVGTTNNSTANVSNIGTSCALVYSSNSGASASSISYFYTISAEL